MDHNGRDQKCSPKYLPWYSLYQQQDRCSHGKKDISDTGSFGVRSDQKGRTQQIQYDQQQQQFRLYRCQSDQHAEGYRNGFASISMIKQGIGVDKPYINGVLSAGEIYMKLLPIMSTRPSYRFENMSNSAPTTSEELSCR